MGHDVSASYRYVCVGAQAMDGIGPGSATVEHEGEHRGDRSLYVGSRYGSRGVGVMVGVGREGSPWGSRWVGTWVGRWVSGAAAGECVREW